MKSKNFYEIRPYTYFIKRKSDGLKYYGLRYANVFSGICPIKDFGINYFSSGILQEEFKSNPDDFEWKLCWTFDTIDEAIEYERMVNTRIYKKNNWANNSCWPCISFTKDVREKLRKKQTGRILSEETKQIMREQKLGDKNPAKRPEVRKKISESNKGQKRSDESKKKMSELKKGKNNPNYGKQRSEETKKKISKKLKSYNLINRNKK